MTRQEKESEAQQLRDRLVALEADRDRIKAFNLSCFLGRRDESLLTDAQLRDFGGYAKSGAGRSSDEALGDIDAEIRRLREKLV